MLVSYARYCCPFLATALLTTCLLTPETLAGEAVEWLSLHSASTLARAEGKLVMIVQGPDSLSTTAKKSNVVKTYVTSALADQRLKGFFEFRAAAHYRPSGVKHRPAAKSHKSAKSKTMRDDDDKVRLTHANVVTYFCAPLKDGRLATLYFFVGFPTSDQLVTHLDWAMQHWNRIKKLPPSDQTKATIDAHAAMLLPEDTIPPAAATPKDLARALKRCDEVRQQRILKRYGEGWTGKQKRQLAHSLRTHVDIEDTSAHQILAANPMVEFAKLEKPAYEALTRQDCNRAATPYTWFIRQRERRTPLLLIVEPDGNQRKTPPINSEFNRRFWRPTNRSIKSLIGQFDTLEKPRDELNVLLLDLGLTLQDADQSNLWRFAVFSANSAEPEFVNTGMTEAKLERAILKQTKGALK